MVFSAAKRWVLGRLRPLLSTYFRDLDVPASGEGGAGGAEAADAAALDRLEQMVEFDAFGSVILRDLVS
jgi:hypothetical protein